MMPRRAPVTLGSLGPDPDRRIEVDTPCPFCGYNLRGLPRGRPCPECGEPEKPVGLEPLPAAAPPAPPGPSFEYDEDEPCPACGYNLRGLPRGQRCPECGNVPGAAARERDRTYGDTRSRRLHDVVLAGGPGERRAWRVGLLLATACVAVALLARIGYLVATMRGVSGAVEQGYVLLGFANSAAWIAAVWLVTPASLARQWRWMAVPRWAARGLSLMWIVGYWCVYLRTGAGGAVPSGVVIGDLGGRLLGGVGAMFVAFILSWVAEEAELTVAARRLNSVVWLLWAPTLLGQAFPSRIAWFTVILLALVLLFWGWVMLLWVLGCLELYHHARWGHRLTQNTGDRAGRIEAKKRAYDDQAAAGVRPLPDAERGRRE